MIVPIEISQMQELQEQRLLKKGFPEKNAREFTRDVVYFPKKVPGTYDRILCKSKITAGLPGVAVLPVLSYGKIALILTYRHATRSWELELPRGRIEPQETFNLFG